MATAETYQRFLATFDDDTGYDILHLFSGPDIIDGYLEDSPLASLVKKKFGLVFSEASEKPYRAHWALDGDGLQLARVNGQLNGKKVYTHDFVPEFPDDSPYYQYPFSGSIRYIIQNEIVPASLEKLPLIRGFRQLLLTFEKGALRELNGIVND